MESISPHRGQPAASMSAPSIQNAGHRPGWQFSLIIASQVP
jgi:hypothetical protein